MINDDLEHRTRSRERGYRVRRDRVLPSKKAEERYPLDKYPCERCEDPKEGLPHLVDNGSEFYWEHQHDSPGSSHRSGCPRFGSSELCAAWPRAGTATSLFVRRLANLGWRYVFRKEEQYIEAKSKVEESGADDRKERTENLRY